MKNCIIVFIILFAAAAVGFAQPRKSKYKRPNIIIILADDLGYSDIGAFGGEINTPNLDYLAANGLRFSQFYNVSRCCPSRASLLTGLYNQQAGIGSMTRDQHQPAYRGYLTENTVTLAEVLKKAGYHTGMVGKWHVSNTVEKSDPKEQLMWLNHQVNYPLFSPIEQYPTSRGFEKFYGTIWGVIDHFDPFSLVNGTKPVEKLSKNYYHTDAINDTASSYIRQFSKENKPFFLYVAHNAPHWPVQALPIDIDKYKDTYKAGWEAIRKARYQKMIAQGLIDPATQPLSPLYGNKSWESNLTKEWDARVMAVHAAMIDRIDQGIGRIIKTLRQTGQLENTLIMFLSDNGASPEVAQVLEPGFDRPGQTRSGQLIIYPKNKDVMPGPQTVYASIGQEWANVANAPLRYWKRESYEGGVRTPFIAYWPKGLKLKKGSITDKVEHVMDFMPTVVELSKAEYPSIYKGHHITPMQGISLVPAFKNLPGKAHDFIFNEHVNGRSVRAGKWKLVKLSSDMPWELYNMDKDKTELSDIALRYPKKVKELDSLWNAWATKNQVLPKPGK
ncbi:arylsulfatase [Mucilaginibacter sp. PAMB04274]|uniref:arylsulfatase n=1 Tax=Mucilaginibacter sp. PAMB04274 TaxID=3138568 RepID=UPI0031F62128